MRIGLYGMPTAGKSYILERLDFIEVVQGSKLLRELNPSFDEMDKSEKDLARKALAKGLKEKPTFIMDGHYAFGDEIAFTENDGDLYDVFLYLYIDPELLEKRLSLSDRNRKYLKYDIDKWQQQEVKSLRDFCHKNDKDFYVVDNPPYNSFDDVSMVIDFIRGIVGGFSCLSKAKECVYDILSKCEGDIITLLDGDKTLTIEDSSNAVFGYKTTIYNGNFYTGYQSWKQDKEFQEYTFDDLSEIPVRLNDRIKSAMTKDSYILTSGHERVWSFISKALNIEFYCGVEMSAETKLFITKFLQKEGKEVVAYGDSMNDYYMLKKANKGFLVTKEDGSISRSLKDMDMEGLCFV